MTMDTTGIIVAPIATRTGMTTGTMIVIRIATITATKIGMTGDMTAGIIGIGTMIAESIGTMDPAPGNHQ